MKTPIDSTRFPGLLRAARSEFRSFKAHLITRFSEEHRSVPQKLRIIFATLAELNFPGISRGRPQDEMITIAYKMRTRKKSWEKVYKACGTVTTEDKTRLRKAVRERKLSRRRRRLREADINSADFCS
jgi:hypothetical protein